jgi:hypothetical protein
VGHNKHGEECLANHAPEDKYTKEAEHGEVQIVPCSIKLSIHCLWQATTVSMVQHGTPNALNVKVSISTYGSVHVEEVVHVRAPVNHDKQYMHAQYKLLELLPHGARRPHEIRDSGSLRVPLVKDHGDASRFRLSCHPPTLIIELALVFLELFVCSKLCSCLKQLLPRATARRTANNGTKHLALCAPLEVSMVACNTNVFQNGVLIPYA